MVRNVHERLIEAPAEQVGSLIDRLATRGDALLWPNGRWPPMRLDRPLAIGARGGHGPVRYFVEEYEPGRRVRFRFTAPRGFVGTHGFEVEETGRPGATLLRHALEMRPEGPARLSWPLVFRPLHDALIEDALDCGATFCESRPATRRRLSAYVRLLRFLLEVASRRRRAADATRAPRRKRGAESNS